MDNYYEADVNSASQASHFYNKIEQIPKPDDTYGGSTSSLEESQPDSYKIN